MSDSSTVSVAVCDVLVVEDNADDERITLRSLQRLEPKPTVSIARDGADALAFLLRAEEHGVAPRLILLDLKLPRHSGFEILTAVRNSVILGHTAVVVLSSSDVSEDLEEAKRLGADGYATKPIDFEEYHTRVAGIARYWLWLDTSQPRGCVVYRSRQ